MLVEKVSVKLRQMLKLNVSMADLWCKVLVNENLKTDSNVSPYSIFVNLCRY